MGEEEKRKGRRDRTDLMLQNVRHRWLCGDLDGLCPVLLLYLIIMSAKPIFLSSWLKPSL